jgi:transposase
MLSQTRRQTHCYAGSPTKFGILAALGGWLLEKAGKNQATLAVARKMVAYMLAVERRQQDFVPSEERAAKAVA